MHLRLIVSLILCKSIYGIFENLCVYTQQIPGMNGYAYERAAKHNNIPTEGEYVIKDLFLSRGKRSSNKHYVENSVAHKTNNTKSFERNLYTKSYNNNNNIFISYIKYTNITPPANSKANQGRWCVDGLRFITIVEVIQIYLHSFIQILKYYGAHGMLRTCSTCTCTWANAKCAKCVNTKSFK